MKARGLLFGVAVAFAIWNIMVNGVNVRTVAIAVMILLCLAMNIYNYHQKKKIRQEEEDQIREGRSPPSSR
jgi:RsiW-degrading membrane proteinase PrsW (M82 family)